jgi:hypothetical protein
LTKLLSDCKVRGHCISKEILVIPVNRVVDKERRIGKNGWPRRRRGTRGHCPPPLSKIAFCNSMKCKKMGNANEMLTSDQCSHFLNYLKGCLGT